MTAPWKSLAKTVVPPKVRSALRTWFGWRWFRGNHATWADARAQAGGYDDAAIVARVLTATQAVRAGQAAYERDGVAFPLAAPEPGLLEACRQAAAVQGRPLRVLDFGGALGSTYWRHRNALAAMVDPQWDIVEQPGCVTAGRTHLDGTPLCFFPSVGEADAVRRHDLLLASGVLQYLEAPGAVLEQWMQQGFRWLLLNNLPLHPAAPDRIAVQHVPPEIYPGSYPVWFFNRERFLSRFNGRYDIRAEFSSEAVWPVGWRRYRSTGLLLQRKEIP